MTLPLPSLDDRTFADLVEEARGLIRTYDPAWTNHNPSDPGITLLELFAWLAEMLLYRSDQVPDRHLVTFLRLLNGPEWEPPRDRPLDEAVRATVLGLRGRYRAVTAADYEALAREASADVARARCVARRYLGGGTEEERLVPRPGHVSVIVLVREGRSEEVASKVRQEVWDHLEPRRLLTTRHDVVAPVWAPVSVELLVARRPDVPAGALRGSVVSALEGFLDPYRGGHDGEGWPFGRAVYVSELHQVLEAVPGVDHVPDVALWSRCPGQEPRCTPAQELWHDDGDLVGLGLADHHLPRAAIDPALVVVSADFVPVEVSARVTAAPGRGRAAVTRAVKAAVRALFHPLHEGPDGTAAWQLGSDRVRRVVGRLPEVGRVASLGVAGDPAHVFADQGVDVVRVEERQLADVRVRVEVE